MPVLSIGMHMGRIRHFPKVFNRDFQCIDVPPSAWQSRRAASQGFSLDDKVYVELPNDPTSFGPGFQNQSLSAAQEKKFGQFL